MDPVTLTIKEACQRHAGLKASTLRMLCLKKKIRAVQVGKNWHIAVKELDRVFVGR